LIEKPLANKRFLITRPQAQVAPFVALLEEQVDKAYNKILDYANNPDNKFRKYVKDRWGEDGVVNEAYQMLKKFLV